MENEINILDYYRIIKKRWLLLFFICSISGSFGLYVAFTSPKIYKAESSLYVLPSGGGAFSQLPSSLLSLAGVKGGSGSDADYLERLLNSDTLALQVAENLKLDRTKEFSVQDIKASADDAGKSKKAKRKPKPFVYDLKNPDAQKIVLQLKKSIKIKNDKKGGLGISCESQSRIRSAKIINTYVKLLRLKMTSRGQRNVKFIRQRLEDVKLNLTAAEDALKQFQEENKIMALDKQLESEVNQYLALKSEQIKNKLSLDGTQKLIQSSGSLEELVSLEGKKIMYETTQAELEQVVQEFDSKLQRYPEKSQKFARLFREVKLQGILFEMFSQQYELERVSQQKEDVYFQVIDPAYPPEEHIRPVKRKIFMIFVAAGIAAGIFLIFFLELMKTAKPSEIVRKEGGIFAE